MRTQKAITNIKMAMIYQISVLFMSFVDRKLFLEILGVEYLGVHGLFGNMISMLALAELGVGTAIIYNLYKPLADQDEEKVTALMKFYKKMYFYIGGIILILGLLMTATLPVFIKDVSLDMQMVRVAYMIFVLGTVGTYWTGYKRSLLYADQKNYKVLVGDMASAIGGAVLKIVVLITYPSYMLYVVVHVVSKIIPNLYAAHQVNRDYPYLKESKGALTVEEKKVVTTNVKDLFIHKVAFFVVTSTDNMIISLFSGVAMVGFVGNYQIIISAIMSFIGQGIEALQAGMGNMITTQDKQEVIAVYEKVQFAVFWIASVTVICLLGLISPFVELWLGPEYLMNQAIIGVMLFNFLLWVMTRPLWQMMSVSGLFKEDKYNALAEMLVNLVISLILVQRIGVIGVFIGTTLSYFVGWYLKARVLYTKFFEGGLKRYLGQIGMYIAIIAAEVVVVKWLLGYVVVETKLLTFVLQCAVCAVVPNVINMVIFYKNKHFVYFKALVLEQIKKAKYINRYDKFITKAIVALLMIIPLHNTALPIGSLIGRFSSVALAMIGIGYVVCQGIVLGNVSKRRQKHVIAYLIFCVGIIIYGMTTGNEEGLKMASNIIAVTCVGVACALIDWRSLGKGVYLVDFGLLMWVIAIVKDIQGLETVTRHGFIFGNSNSQGIFCILMIAIVAMMYAISKGERYLLYILVLLAFMNMTGSRTSQLAFVAGLGCYMVWVITSRWRVTHYAVFVVLAGGIAAITYIYPQLLSGEYANQLNKFIAEVTGKGLFTGREDMWIQALGAIREKPLLGYGLHTQVQQEFEQVFYAWKQGAHNEFLQLAIWTGAIGVTSAVATLGYLWHCLYRGRKSKIARVGGSVLVMVMVMATFESVLLGEVIPFSMLQWTIVGMGLSVCKVNN